MPKFINMLGWKYMDAYCERIDPGLFAEPLNAISNISFLIAAWAAWTLAKRKGTLTTGVKILIAFGVLTGIGSVVWHTYPTSTTLVLDIVPIFFFIISYIWLYTRHVLKKGLGISLVSIAVFLAAVYISMPYAKILHGAPVYIPGLLVVLIFGMYHALQQKTARVALLYTAGVYFVALYFRTIDQELCHYQRFGTHFIWHALIGLVTYMAMRSLIVGFVRDKTERELS